MPGGPSWRNGCRPARGSPPGTCCARPRRCSPATAAPAPRTAAARPGRPHLPGGPGPPPAIGPLPAASRSRFAADLLTIVSRERQAQNYGAAVTGTWNAQTQCLGAFIRTRRQLARLSLRQLAEMTSLSDPYLSQLERGLHLPSVRVLKLLSAACSAPSAPLRRRCATCRNPGCGNRSPKSPTGTRTRRPCQIAPKVPCHLPPKVTAVPVGEAACYQR